MRLVAILMVFSTGLALSQALAQPPELRVPLAPLPSETRGALAPEPASPPPGSPVERGPLAADGQPSAPGLTLAELEAMAERCNPTLAQAAARVQAARGQCLQVGLYPNPVTGYLGSEIGNDGRGGTARRFHRSGGRHRRKAAIEPGRCQPRDSTG